MHRSLAIALFAAFAFALPSRAEPDHSRTEIRDMLMTKVDAMNAQKQGIFHEDITPAVASYFPLGQPMAETKRILAAQKLGPLKPFKGTNDAGMGTMYVAKSDLTSHVFSHVYVVLDFDYDGAAPGMKLKAMKAFLRAVSM